MGTVTNFAHLDYEKRRSVGVIEGSGRIQVSHAALLLSKSGYTKQGLHLSAWYNLILVRIG